MGDSVASALSKPVILDFKYDRQEYIRAVRFHFIHSMRLKLDLLVAAVMGLVGVYDLWAGGLSWLGAASFMIAALLLMIVFCALFVVPNQLYRGSDKLKQRYHLEFSEDGIYFKTPDIDSHLKWDLYNRWVEGSDFFILYYGNREFSVAPKRVFKDHDELNRFRELLSRKIGPRQ